MLLETVLFLLKQPLKPLVPFWNNWKGIVIKEGNIYKTKGIYKNNTIIELPIGTSIEKYIEHMTKLQNEKMLQKREFLLL